MTDVLCSVCGTRPATHFMSKTPRGACDVCSTLPSLPVFATTIAGLNAPVPEPARLPRHHPFETWHPRLTTLTQNQTAICILWESRVIAPEPAPKLICHVGWSCTCGAMNSAGNTCCAVCGGPYK